MIDFEFDLHETVEWAGVGTLALRTAVRRVMALSPGSRRLICLYRNAGKEPAFLSVRHIEQLAGLPEFTGAN